LFSIALQNSAHKQYNMGIVALQGGTENNL